MMHGIRVKPLRIIPDDRSRLMEIPGSDDDLLIRFGQLYMTTVYPRGRERLALRQEAGG